MTNLETLEERIENYVNINELQHQGIMYKLDDIHRDIVKDLLSHTNRIEKIEKETEKQKEARVYIIAVATILALLIPILVQIVI